MADKPRIFRLLLYKNYLVRKRHWKLGIFVEVLIPFLLFASVWGIRNLVANPPQVLPNNIIYPEEDIKHNLPIDKLHLYVVPSNRFIGLLMNDVRKCLLMPAQSSAVTIFDKEETMIDAFYSNNSNFKFNVMAVIFENRSLDTSTTNFAYKILTPNKLPEVFDNSMYIIHRGFVELQLCLDETFIKLKARGQNLNFHIKKQRMPSLAHVEPDFADDTARQIFCAFALIAFLIPLCIETSNASDEKFLGTNVLMSMNGVYNYMNLLSWLVSGLIFSLFYIIPIVILLNLTSTENAYPYLYYANSFIFWIILTVHLAHLITFGMHISAYFTRSLFMITGLIVIYIGSTIMQKYCIKENIITSYLGIFFPNILLLRACEEINYYESIMRGIHWTNLFKVEKPAYGIEGSIGMIIIFSLIGIIFHFTMANYIYAINPGKYGIKKGPFYFLKYLKCERRAHDYDKVENFDFNDTEGQPFESVSGAYTPGIQIRNLKKAYNTSLFTRQKVHALNGISVDFYQGQITALLGHNGAGKTTTMSILTGMIGATEGLVLINGKNVADKAEEIMNDTGLCPQENMLFPSLSVYEQLLFFYMLKNKSKPKSVAKTEVKAFLKKFKLFEKRHSLPSKLSGGQKRRVCLGMALIGNSSTLILDEPTSGLDPESKRDIWNILLKMRGEKTILISTHDMEEADILGDRIAIIHNGILKSYGTSMFLKKMLGKGNIEVTLSTTSRCDPEKVRKLLDPQNELISSDGGKLVFSVPQTSALPDTLDKIENKKKDLGVTGMSVSLITIEQVFLKVTQDSDDPTESKQPFETAKKLKGQERSLHSAMALLCKKMTYTLKNIATIFTILLLLIIPLICISFILRDVNLMTNQIIPIRLDVYDGARTAYRTDNYSKTFGYNYKAATIRDNGLTIRNLRNDLNFIDALIDYGSQDLVSYNYQLISGAEFNSSNNYVTAKALYNAEKARFSLPISINLITNALIKTFFNGHHSIRATGQEFLRFNDYLDISLKFSFGIVQGCVSAIVLVFFLYPAVALFVVHPIRESISGIKLLQRMTGVSCGNYWGTMFLFDFLVLLIMIIFVVFGFIIMDLVLELRILGIIEILIMLLLFVLFAINILPLVYTFSFLKKSTTTAIKLLSLIPLAIVSVELILCLVTNGLDGHSRTMNIIRPFQKAIFFLLPYVSFLHGKMSFLKTAKLNAVCKRMSTMYSAEELCRYSNCCELKCFNGVCQKSFSYFGTFTEDIALEASVLSLCLTPILYFSILWALEYKLIPVLSSKMCISKPIISDHDLEEQVKKEKHTVAFEISKISSRRRNTNTNGAVNPGTSEPENAENKADGDNKSGIVRSESQSDNYIFFVYELRKKFGRLVAVQDLSFGVKQGQCFGLLGVNGAGKTTSFKMMTGEIIPNNGMIYLQNVNIRKHRENTLSEMGYCPQNDALIRSLNAYDHLRLFARLRGIPENDVKAEVRKWINRLNLKSCASQPSGTYSGGNKRRLNIAIALIGIPNLVLMDEPTTGVDPAARRSLWNVIQSCQATGQAVIFTSHSMIECEVLCNRLGIMVDGKLMCIGPSEELKQRFGAGFDIQIKMDPEKSQEEIESIKKEITDSLHCELIDEHSGYLMYHLKSTEITWRKMYDILNDLKARYTSIEDFSALSSTLERLFLLFARTADKSKSKSS